MQVIRAGTPAATHTAYAADVDARYQTIARNASRSIASVVTGAAVYAVQPGGAVVTQATSLPQLFYIDPDDYSISGRTTKLRVVAGCLVSDTAPATTLTLGLYPVTNMSGGASTSNPNFGTVVTGTTVAFASPGVNTESAQTYTSGINLPAEGWYGLGIDALGAMAANSVVTIPFRVEVRNI